jgi:IMP dehydrogenase
MDNDEKIVGTGITFDDVLLLPRYSEVTPDMVSLKTQLSKHITLNIPFLSAAMDTVTESQMAIALAREGGIGIIHKNMTIERQADEVDKVKRSENGVIKDPITVTKDKKLSEVLSLMAKYHISGIPVVDKDDYLVGIITNRDLKFENDFSKTVEEVMTKAPLVTGKKGTTIEEAEAILAESKKEKLPLVDEKGRSGRSHHHQGYREDQTISECGEGFLWPTSLRSRGWHHQRSDRKSDCPRESGG